MNHSGVDKNGERDSTSHTLQRILINRNLVLHERDNTILLPPEKGNKAKLVELLIQRPVTFLGFLLKYIKCYFIQNELY